MSGTLEPNNSDNEEGNIAESEAESCDSDKVLNLTKGEAKEEDEFQEGKNGFSNTPNIAASLYAALANLQSGSFPLTQVDR